MNPAGPLRLILRVIGSSSLLGVIFVVAPYEWMNSIHADLGLGQLSDQPVVGYLARSTSAFYAILGGLFWVVSFDLPRHRTVLVYVGSAFVPFGAALLVIDYLAGLPPFWVLWEGPFIVFLGLVIVALARRLPTPAGASRQFGGVAVR